jgi:hypothetical protein
VVDTDSRGGGWDLAVVDRDDAGAPRQGLGRGGGAAATARGRERTRRRGTAGRRSGGAAEWTVSGVACWLRRIAEASGRRGEALGKTSRVGEASRRRGEADGVEASGPERCGAPAPGKSRGQARCTRGCGLPNDGGDWAEGRIPRGGHIQGKLGDPSGILGSQMSPKWGGSECREENLAHQNIIYF